MYQLIWRPGESRGERMLGRNAQSRDVRSIPIYTGYARPSTGMVPDTFKPDRGHRGKCERKCK